MKTLKNYLHKWIFKGREISKKLVRLFREKLSENPKKWFNKGHWPQILNLATRQTPITYKALRPLLRKIEKKKAREECL